MTLADLRRLAVRKQLDIHFRLSGGLECVVTRQGVARVPDLKRVPDFNLEEELARAGEFLVEPAAPAKGGKAAAGPVGRAELEAMAAASGAGAVPAHDEE